MTQKTGLPIIAVLGNPNSGKSSLFNYLTGMRQDVSNFPGVTVDKKTASMVLPSGKAIQIIDFPGTYSVFPNSAEEKLVINTIINPDDANFPDAVLYVADVTQLDRHLLFATQIRDLGFPMVFILNMVDIAEAAGTKIDPIVLEKYLGCKVILTSVRTEKGLSEIMPAIDSMLDKNNHPVGVLYQSTEKENVVASAVASLLNTTNLYRAKLIAHHVEWLSFLSPIQKEGITKINQSEDFNDIRFQVLETMNRFGHHSQVVHKTTTKCPSTDETWTDKIDNWITHKIWGPIIFFTIMLIVFQSIYSWAELPMEWIEKGFAVAGSFLNANLQDSWWSDLLINGVLAGLGGVLVFVPQITILFFLIALLEESGYMSRVVYMFDSIMQHLGMNGRSMVSLISSGACAIPAIMATRTISNQKERLITILVSPLISCSARLPVYAVLIGFVVPDTKILKFINLQGLVFMGLYLLGIIGVIVSSLFFKKILKSESASYLMIELPNYKPPIWKNVVLLVKEKVSSFIIGAGQIILLISVILWFLASYGPGDKMQQSISNAEKYSIENGLNEEEKNHVVASYKLESSYIGHLGKFIEPAISPLGFDWKIGIALLTSFAAREVFVGTMATIYSVGNDSDEKTIRQKMAAEVRPGTNIKIYNPASALSLLVFYVFAMQCMSTLAITKKETNTWKWSIVQFSYMGILAYLGAFTVYHLLS